MGGGSERDVAGWCWADYGVSSGRSCQRDVARFELRSSSVAAFSEGDCDGGDTGLPLRAVMTWLVLFVCASDIAVTARFVSSRAWPNQLDDFRRFGCVVC